MSLFCDGFEVMHSTLMITVAFVSAEMIPAIYEMALKQSPNNEELHSHLFMAYVRIGEYKKQQQVVAS